MKIRWHKTIKKHRTKALRTMKIKHDKNTKIKNEKTWFKTWQKTWVEKWWHKCWTGFERRFKRDLKRDRKRDGKPERKPKPGKTKARQADRPTAPQPGRQAWRLGRARQAGLPLDLRHGPVGWPPTGQRHVFETLLGTALSLSHVFADVCCDVDKEVYVFYYVFSGFSKTLNRVKIMFLNMSQKWATAVAGNVHRKRRK